MGLKIMDELGYGVQLRDDVRYVSIELILEEFGWPMVSRLIGIARGKELLIPRSAEELAQALGPAFAGPLTERFAGRRCEIPADGSALLEARDRAVREDRKAGLTHEALQTKYHLTQPQLLQALRMVEG